MEGYLLDTCAISAYLDPGHPNHAPVHNVIEAIERGAPKFVSCVVLAEIRFGLLLDEAATGKQSPRTVAILREAQKYGIREITKHTADDYAELKKNLAVTYLDNYLRSNRPRWVEEWVDRVTGQKLQVDENDLWICAQAREWNLVLITTDKNMVDRVSKADPTVRFRLVSVP